MINHYHSFNWCLYSSWRVTPRSPCSTCLCARSGPTTRPSATDSPRKPTQRTRPGSTPETTKRRFVFANVSQMDFVREDLGLREYFSRGRMPTPLHLLLKQSRSPISNISGGRGEAGGQHVAAVESQGERQRQRQQQPRPWGGQSRTQHGGQNSLGRRDLKPQTPTQGDRQAFLV